MTKTEKIVAEFKAAYRAAYQYEAHVTTKRNGYHFVGGYGQYWRSAQLVDWAARLRRMAQTRDSMAASA